ncbi:uncharacterized protein TNCV_2297351 [Trichonephila clavipes]|nr:uncharacterized protein TNCV_2297351 [Trichonephila clavipes]
MNETMNEMAERVNSNHSNEETRNSFWGLAKSKPGPDEIDNLIEEVIDLAWQINLEVDSDDVQELLDLHNQEFTIDKLTEMHEQETLKNLRL